MMALIGTAALASDGCGPCTAAEPPPPYIPPYTADEAIQCFKAGDCGRALGDWQVASADLRGFQSEGGPTVFLDLVLLSPPSPLGVRYRTTTSVALVPEEGAVADTRECAENLRTLLVAATRAMGKAESTPEVTAFIAEHAQASTVTATFESHVQPRGRILFSAARAEGSPAILTWE